MARKTSRVDMPTAGYGSRQKKSKYGTFLAVFEKLSRQFMMNCRDKSYCGDGIRIIILSPVNMAGIGNG